MKLAIDQAAPQFDLNDIYGRTINLEHYREKRILIAFFRHAGCPFCNLRVHALSKAHAELKEMGFEMIFFFESTAKVILRSTFHQGVSPIPIIADPEKATYALYGLEPSLGKSVVSHLSTFVSVVSKARSLGLPVHLMASGESFSTMPAEFLVDKEFSIRELHYSERLDDRLEIESIK
jgi:peroxiredoxin